MSRAKRADYSKTELRLEMLERRLDTLERALLANKPENNNLTSELLSTVLTLMKQQNNHPSTPKGVEVSKQQEVVSGESHVDDHTGATQLDKSKVGFYRRAGIM